MRARGVAVRRTKEELTVGMNDVLVGKIVAWPNSDEMDRLAGHGEIVAALESPFLLVRKRPSHGDAEPSYMLVLGVDEPELVFFDTEDRHDAWLASMLNDVDPGLTRARRRNRPKR